MPHQVLVLLRDPVSRALSRFLEFKTQRHLADYYPDALEVRLRACLCARVDFLFVLAG